VKFIENLTILTNLRVFIKMVVNNFIHFYFRFNFIQYFLNQKSLFKRIMIKIKNKSLFFNIFHYFFVIFNQPLCVIQQINPTIFEIFLSWNLKIKIIYQRLIKLYFIIYVIFQLVLLSLVQFWMFILQF
jgi:hypothetical protein